MKKDIGQWLKWLKKDDVITNVCKTQKDQSEKRNLQRYFHYAVHLFFPFPFSLEYYKLENVLASEIEVIKGVE